MLDSWNEGIFCAIKSRLQSSAMKLVHAERNGEAFDSQLVIGVRESYGKRNVICYLQIVSFKGAVSRFYHDFERCKTHLDLT